MRRLALNLIPLLLLTCREPQLPTASYQQSAAQGAEGAVGQNEHFYFLPPLAPEPSPTGIFAATLAPLVQICEWTGTDCVLPPIAEFTTTTGPGSQRVRVVPEDEQYVVNWHTKGLDRTKTYRVRVLFRIQDERVRIERELGHVDVTVSENVLPVKFRIEKGVFPIGELTPLQRAKLSPVLLEQFVSQDLIEPVEILVNVVDDRLPIPELAGVEVLRDWRPTLAKVFARTGNAAALALLVQSNNTKYVYEDRKYFPLKKPSASQVIIDESPAQQAWQVIIGQNSVQQAGYIGAQTAVAILDDGGRGLGDYGAPLPNHGVIDLSVPAFGGCTAAGTPASCRVATELNPAWADLFRWDHATIVGMRLARTAPGTGLIAYDVGFDGTIDAGLLGEAMWWVIQHRNDYNIVAVNMSFGSDADGPQPAGPFSTEACPTQDDDDFQRLRDAGIMPIAGAGNDGSWQFQHDAFYGISHPACSPLVVSVGGSDEADEIWSGGTRGPNLDLLAPAIDRDPYSQGTSNSAPTVAGAWAIIRAARPDLSLDETLELLKTTGVPILDPYSGLTFPRIQLDAALLATSSRAEIRGSVTTGGALTPGALVSMQEIETGTELSAVTNAGGFFRFPYVFPGTYKVRARLVGVGVMEEVVTLGPGEIKTVNFPF